MRLAPWLCALVVLLAACSTTEVSPPVSSTTPAISSHGPTNIFGLELAIDPKVWRQAAIKSTPTEFWMDSSNGGQLCSGQCPSMLIATAQSQYYRLSTHRDGTVFRTETECENGASAFATAEEREPLIAVGGEPVQYFVNPHCEAFKRASDGSRERHTWFLPGKGFLIQLLPGTSSTVLGEAKAMLQRCRWVGK